MFCDICEAEIGANEESSLFQFIRFVMHTSGMEPVKVGELYCSGCTKKIREVAEGLKKK